jgi:signal transduction histidine kinase
MPTPSGWLFAAPYHVLLAGALGAAFVLSWLVWRREPTPESRAVWLGAACVLATTALAVPFALIANARGMNDALWVGPLDRLLLVTVLVLLGWTVVQASRPWRMFLAAGFAAATIAYVSWAPTWAAEILEAPALAGAAELSTPAAGTARIWDGLLLVLAVTVAAGLARTTPRIPRWVVGAAGAIALGAALSVTDATAAFPSWSRLGTLAAGGFFVAAAVHQFVEMRRAHAGPAPLARATTRAAAVADAIEPSLDSIATAALFETVGRLRAEPALFCLVSEAGELTVWGVARRGEGSRRLGDLPLASHPTIAGALENGARLRSSRAARDVTQLYGLMGIHADGAALLEPIRGSGVHGVLVVGRRDGRWTDADQTALATLAARTARRLDTLEGTAGPEQFERIFDVIETQTDSVTRLARIVEGLSERMATLEASPEAIQHDLTELEARVLQYEVAIDSLPWGIMVADADGGLVFGNAASLRLLAVEGVTAGQPIRDMFPDADRIAFALARCQERRSGSGPVEALFESPSLRVELEPLMDERLGYLGCVAVVRPRIAGDLGVEGDMMLALAEALRSPITCILGYSNLLSVGQGLSQEQLDRYLQRIDSNLARMQVQLTNLVTVLEIGGDRLQLGSSALDPSTALSAAADRASVQMAEKALVLSVEAESGLPQVAADPEALTQILDNLIANAAVRSPQGGDIVATAALREDRGARAIVFTVTDRGQALGGGRGTLELTDTAVTGVGATVVRLLAERQGGGAWAESGQAGTSFLVRLPIFRSLAEGEVSDAEVSATPE